MIDGSGSRWRTPNNLVAAARPGQPFARIEPVSAPHLPYQPPPWLTVRKIAAAAAALAVVPWLRDGGTAASVSLALIGICAPLQLIPLVAIVMWRRSRPSHDAPIRMLRDAGAWLAGSNVIFLPLREPFIPGLWVGAILVAVALVWLDLRRAFVARLRAAIRTETTPSPPMSNDGAQPYLDEGLLPYQLGGYEAAYELLVWQPASGSAGAYRDTAPPVTVALVPVRDRDR
jgi:hypothetical protein